MSKSKCIIILSEKSSGSSACQNLLARFADIRHVEKTRHSQHETLYWVKAASILGYPQIKMLDSEVPIAPDQAKNDLRDLLVKNLGSPKLPQGDSELIFEGWRQLCESHSPIFVEKSPHHLCQWSAIELILEARERLPEVDFFIVGLIRNPMDTLYSQFQRWRTPPERLQYQWSTAYSNLLKLRDTVEDNLMIIRYEDMVSSVKCLKPLLDFCAVEVRDKDKNFFHTHSVTKYRRDHRFGFQLADDVANVARAYGYSDSDLSNNTWWLWPMYRRVARFSYYTLRYAKRTT